MGAWGEVANVFTLRNMSRAAGGKSVYLPLVLTIIIIQILPKQEAVRRLYWLSTCHHQSKPSKRQRANSEWVESFSMCHRNGVGYVLRLYNFLHERFRCHTIINCACHCCYATALCGIFCRDPVIQCGCSAAQQQICMAWLKRQKVLANLMISSHNPRHQQCQEAVHKHWQQMPLNASTSGCLTFIFTFYIERPDSWQWIEWRCQREVIEKH